MKASGLKQLFFFSLLVLSGCTYGFIYTDVTTPLTLNLAQTKTAKNSGNSGYYSIQEPISGYGIRVEWASHGIGDIAKNYNIETVHYADIRYRNILGGIWQKREVRVYGQPRPNFKENSQNNRTNSKSLSGG